MMKYRLQKRDRLGVVPRAYAGRVISWGKWRTVKESPDLEQIQADFDWMSKRGLCQWRIMYGKDVVRKAM